MLTVFSFEGHKDSCVYWIKRLGESQILAIATALLLLTAGGRYRDLPGLRPWCLSAAVPAALEQSPGDGGSRARTSPCRWC